MTSINVLQELVNKVRFGMLETSILPKFREVRDKSRGDWSVDDIVKGYRRSTDEGDRMVEGKVNFILDSNNVIDRNAGVVGKVRESVVRPVFDILGVSIK